MSSKSPTRNASPLVTVLLIALGVALVAVGVVYLVQTAGQLPSVFPGHQAGSAHHHTKHALLAFGLAALALIGAWMSAGKNHPASCALPGSTIRPSRSRTVYLQPGRPLTAARLGGQVVQVTWTTRVCRSRLWMSPGSSLRLGSADP